MVKEHNASSTKCSYARPLLSSKSKEVPESMNSDTKTECTAPESEEGEDNAVRIKGQDTNY